MKIACKLTRNGNATTICIPVRMLRHLRWFAGDAMIVELTDHDTITVHPPRVVDLRTPGVLGVLNGHTADATK